MKVHTVSEYGKLMRLAAERADELGELRAGIQNVLLLADQRKFTPQEALEKIELLLKGRGNP